MATIVFTALGTMLGGPIGGLIGAVAGQAVDSSLFGGSVQGPRLNSLAITTSAYGSAISRHFGTMRVAGSIIWATNLVEHSQTTGGKGSPSVTTYTYTSSFAVALASRPIIGIGRIWADGNLLRRGRDSELVLKCAIAKQDDRHDQRCDAYGNQQINERKTFFVFCCHKMVLMIIQ